MMRPKSCGPLRVMSLFGAAIIVTFRVKLFAGILAIALVLATGATAFACQEVIVEPLERRAEKAMAVFRARVLQARVLQLADLGIACDKALDGLLCEVLEVGLEVREDFKGNAVSYETIYAPSVPLCSIPIIPGLEYVFFLEDYDLEGDNRLAGPGPGTFRIGDLGSQKTLNWLRAWKAAQQRSN